MKWIANIKKIGKKAVDNKDGMVILFGEGANKDLEDVSVIQKFSTETPVSGFVFKKGDTITVACPNAFMLLSTIGQTQFATQV